MNDLTQTQHGLPDICGSANNFLEARTDSNHTKLSRKSAIDFTRIRSAFAVALHMHQALILASREDLKTAEIASNLQYMPRKVESGHALMLRPRRNSEV
jgi:hypothetical protein